MLAAQLAAPSSHIWPQLAARLPRLSHPGSGVRGHSFVWISLIEPARLGIVEGGGKSRCEALSQLNVTFELDEWDCHPGKGNCPD